jgi:hypothetical protein
MAIHPEGRVSTLGVQGERHGRAKRKIVFGPHFPEVVAALSDVPFEQFVEQFVLHGELVIELNGRVTF